MENESIFQEKREKVLGKKRRRPAWTYLLLLGAALLLTGVAYGILSGRRDPGPSQPRVTEKLDYRGQTIRMAEVQVKVENGKILLPLQTLKEKKMVWFEYEGNGLRVPLYAYLTMAGRVVTGISLCEPCRSTRFRIQDQKLVCNACDTEWEIGTHRGIRGGCMEYPPEIIPSSLEGDWIVIEEKAILEWRPRV
ncbi:MAG: DUF2318 domain-containing protein [Desulfobacterota bacterium]|nr:DUF2318 domain-containing protein [Thermodesulfobacteriota bacterium]